MTVDFLAFATGGGANVESQAAFAADPTTSTGFIAGIGLSAKLNKVWRQSSFISAGLATFVATNAAVNVLDDGNLAGFVTNLTTAITNLVASGSRWSGTSGGSANAQTLTPTPAAAAYTTGNSYAFVAGFTNTNATTINISALGAKNIYKDGPSGPIPLTGGEIVANNVYTIRYDGTQFQLVATELGTISLQNANAVTISGGSIAGTSFDNGVIGGSTPLAGHFTTLSATGHITFEGVTSTGATGTGLLAFATSPSFTTPALGVASATSLAIGGATIGSNGLAVTGHLLLEGVTSTGATGTGNLVFSASPTFTGTVTGPDILKVTGNAANLGILSGRAAFGRLTAIASSNAIVQIDDSASQGLILGHDTGHTSITSISFANDNGVVGSISTLNSATAFNTSSDYRIKTCKLSDDGVTPLRFTGALDVIDLIPVWLAGFNSELADDPSAYRAMVFAHDLQSAIPHAVTGEKDGMTDVGNLIRADGEIIMSGVKEPILKTGEHWEKTGSVMEIQLADFSKAVELLIAGLQEMRQDFRGQDVRLAAVEGKV